MGDHPEANLRASATTRNHAHSTTGKGETPPTRYTLDMLFHYSARWGALVVLGAALAGVSGCSGDSPSGGSAAGGSGGSVDGGGGSAGSAANGGSTSGGGTGGTTTGGSAGAGGSSGSGGAPAEAGTLWQPTPGTSWQWQLSGTLDTTIDVAMYDVDLFDTPDAKLATLKADGRIIICYLSAGSREDWRSDAGDFAANDYGNALAGWPGENWLDIRSANVRKIMQARLDRAQARGCDGVEPDNVDGYANSTGFPLTKQDQLGYDTFIAHEAHARGLSVGLKNAVELVQTLEPSFDWALNEECMTYSECGQLKPFLDANKAVFHVEYVNQTSQGAAKQASVCGDTSIQGFSTLIKTWDLGAWRLTCP